MGIKFLNKYLLTNCSSHSIHETNVRTLKNKVIVVDVSIYLYKYVGDDTLESSLKTLITLFSNNNIRLIFVFDGKPPVEKHELLQRRKIEKQNAEKKYNETVNMLIDETDDTNKKIVENELANIKKQFVRVTYANIQTAKGIMDSMNISYIHAPGEADTLCAHMVYSGLAWGCLSDDMDMLVYGCNFVLRNIDIHRETLMIYNLKSILVDIRLTMSMFRDIAVVSGTDYCSNNNTSLSKTLKFFKKYNIQIKHNLTILSFYDWLDKNTGYIEDRGRLAKTYSMFEMTSYPELYKFSESCNLSIKYNEVIIAI